MAPVPVPTHSTFTGRTFCSSRKRSSNIASTRFVRLEAENLGSSSRGRLQKFRLSLLCNGTFLKICLLFPPFLRPSFSNLRPFAPLLSASGSGSSPGEPEPGCFPYLEGRRCFCLHFSFLSIFSDSILDRRFGAPIFSVFRERRCRSSDWIFHSLSLSCPKVRNPPDEGCSARLQ